MLTLALSVAARPSPALAQSVEAEIRDGSEVSRAFFKRGLALAREKRFIEAQVAFARSIEEDPPLEAYFGLGQVELALGHPCAAQRAYSDYLQRGGERVASEKRERLQRHINELLEQGASPELCAPGPAHSLVLHCWEPNVSASLDGEPVGLENPIEGIAVGRHQVRFLSATTSPQPLTVEVIGNTHVYCSQLQKEAAVKPLGPDVAAPPAFKPRQKLAMAVSGAGLGLAAATLAHLFWNHGRYGVWKDRHLELELGGGSADQRSDHNDLARAIDRASDVTLGLAVASGVVLGAGLTIFFVAPPKKKSNTGQAPGLVNVARANSVGRLRAGWASIEWESRW